MNGKELIVSVFLEEEELGRFLLSDDKEYIFSVFSKERDKTHIHFTAVKQPDNKTLLKIKGNPYDGCISLEYCGYFDHGPHVGRLPKKHWKFIVNWLSNNTNFKRVCELWNEANPRYQMKNAIPKDPNDIDFNPYK